MTFFRSLAMAFLTFSRIPVPQVEWTPKAMRYMMCFFPLVGAVVGLLAGLWCWLCELAGFGPSLRALGVTVVPLLVTGGIHMDGFCDTVDALASNAGPERKREILKDPHSGAFAVVGACAFLLSYFAFASELPFSQMGAASLAVALTCLHVLSRCLSSIATVAFPLAEGDGMLAAEHRSSEKLPSLVFCSALAAAAVTALVVWRPLVGVTMAAAALLVLLAVRRLALRSFGGMSGDLAGFFLQVCELVMLACLCIVSKVVF